MNQGQYRRVSALFTEARSLDGAQRAELLERARERDSEVAEKVMTLLEQERTAPGFLEVAHLGEDFSLAGAEGMLDSGPLLPEKIERYTIEGLIGMGGMGIVYHGRQPSPQRDVAVKVMRPGIVSVDKRLRFQYEVELLGRLDHPGIAKILEAGTHESELGPVPFFAMELVRGRSLLEYAREPGRSRAELVELLIRVCDAVQHAHERGVVHRDLKPANILVTEGGQPKVLDFGIARATDYGVRSVERLTETGQLVGTLTYMSPEQLAGDDREVDTRSDVYALGAVAYEVLVGQPPFNLDERSLPEAARILTERSPAPAGSVRPSLKGDLETILGKALERDPARRYDSAAALAADLRRYLHSEAILARPPSALYQLKMFARRRRGLVASGIALLLALAVGFGMTLWSLVEVKAAKTETELEAARLDRVRAYLVDVFLSVRMGREERDVTLLEILEGVPEELQQRFADEPETHLDLLLTVGATFTNLGDYERAQGDLERCLELSSHLPEDDPLVLHTKIHLGQNLALQGRHEEGEAYLRQVLETARGAPDLADRARFLVDALKLMGAGVRFTDPGRAEELLREALTESAGLEDDEVSAKLHVSVRSSLAGVLSVQARYEEARAMYEEAIDLSHGTMEPGCPESLDLLTDYSLVLRRLGDNEACKEVLEEVLRIRKETLGAQDFGTMLTLNQLALLTLNMQGPEQAQPLFAEASEGLAAALGPGHPEALIALANVAHCELQRKRHVVAEALLTDVIQRMDEHLPPDHRYALTPRFDLARLYLGQERYAQAEPLFLACLESLQTQFGEAHPNVLKVRATLVQLYEAWDRPEQAARYRSGPAEDD